MTSWCQWCGKQITSSGGYCPCTGGQFIYIPSWYTVDESGKIVVSDPGWEGPVKYLPDRYKTQGSVKYLPDRYTRDRT